MRKMLFVTFLVLISGLMISTHTASIQKLTNIFLAHWQVIPWGIRAVNAPSAWDNLTGKGVKVAILDSGIDFHHPDLCRNVKKGYNSLNPKTLPVDDYGHGTLVAGIIGVQNNEIGTVGVAPDAELYPIKVLDQKGEGDLKDVADGIEWCINNGIDIINMSFAISEDKPLLQRAVRKAIDNGIIIVASASNSHGGKVGYPSSYKNVVSVTLVDRKFRIGDKASQGKIDFSAPGVDILTTAKGGCYATSTGSSLAAPYVAGLIALILENPKQFGKKLQGEDMHTYIYRVLRSMSKDLGDGGMDGDYGHGFPSMAPF